jgi:hypothetical protein
MPRVLSEQEVRSRLTEAVAARGRRAVADAAGVSEETLRRVTVGKLGVSRPILRAIGLDWAVVEGVTP